MPAERPDRARLESEILAWMAEPDATRDEARFEALALELFRFQYDACTPYRRYCDALGRNPESVARANDVPPVPTGAFKEFALRCFPEEETILTFHTSGTATDRPGALHLDTLVLYEASLLASLRRCFLTDLRDARPTMRFLALSPAHAPHSSLTHMFATLAAAHGSEESGYDLKPEGLDLASLRRAVESARRRDRPIVIAGTSFAFVHFLDATEADALDATEADALAASKADARGAAQACDWRLPRGSRVLETGGFKGKSRELPREVLRTAIAARFGIPEQAVINQYGMTELGSQFYDSTLVDPTGPRRKLAPPWTRVRCVDPDSGQEVPSGEVGVVVIHDLANTGSVAAIQTADLGRVIPAAAGEGFDVLGRAEGAELRGCGIAVEAVLGESRARGAAGR
jgi:acyl-CoA synthetase (AMP-forming)/AMP-acid ligase II